MLSKKFSRFVSQLHLFEDTKSPKHMCKPTLCWRENLVDFDNTECQ